MRLPKAPTKLRSDSRKPRRFLYLLRAAAPFADCPPKMVVRRPAAVTKHLDGEAVDKPVYGKFINRARRWKDLYRSDRGGRPLFA